MAKGHVGLTNTRAHDAPEESALRNELGVVGARKHLAEGEQRRVGNGTLWGLVNSGLAWMALSAVLFSGMNFLARIASGHASWALVAGVRALVGALVAYLVARARSVPLRVHDRRGIWLRSAFGTAAMLCTFSTLASPAITLGDASTLLNLTPVFLAVLGPFFLRERLERRVIIAIPLCVAGVVLVLRPSFIFGGAPLTGAALVAAADGVASSIFAAFAMMLLRKMGPKERPEAIALHFSLFAATACLLIALPTSHALPRGRDLLTMGGAGVCAGLAQIALTRAYSLEPAARVSGVGYLSVVLSAVLGIAFLGESSPPGAVTGMALVVAGGLVVTVAGMRQRA
jgi:drug/metabolite transporter (DMT)-like permease